MTETQERRSRPPYASAADLDAFFGRIARMGDPGTIDKVWVTNYKLASTQPSGILSALRWLGVIDDQGRSTGVWNDVRLPATRQEKLDELVHAAYKDVFDRIDVSQATGEDLVGTFAQAYGSGDAGRQVTCFVALCRHAGIQTSARAASSPEAETDSRKRPAAGPAMKTRAGKERKDTGLKPKAREQQRGESPTVFISLNVEIPAEWSEEQIRERYDAVRRATGADATDAT